MPDVLSPWIVLEYMEHGDLKSFLTVSNKDIHTFTLLSFSRSLSEYQFHWSFSFLEERAIGATNGQVHGGHCHGNALHIRERAGPQSKLPSQWNPSLTISLIRTPFSPEALFQQAI